MSHFDQVPAIEASRGGIFISPQRFSTRCRPAPDNRPDGTVLSRHLDVRPSMADSVHGRRQHLRAVARLPRTVAIRRRRCDGFTSTKATTPRRLSTHICTRTRAAAFCSKCSRNSPTPLTARSGRRGRAGGANIAQ